LETKSHSVTLGAVVCNVFELNDFPAFKRVVFRHDFVVVAFHLVRKQAQCRQLQTAHWASLFKIRTNYASLSYKWARPFERIYTRR